MVEDKRKLRPQEQPQPPPEQESNKTNNDGDCLRHIHTIAGGFVEGGSSKSA